MAGQRAHWGSRVGFVLAAAGSAVGLGNIWGFPYMTGTHGGGLFVIVYLVCVAVIGLPVMMAEIFLGRTTQMSPVGAFRALSKPGSSWMSLGWLSVAAAFIILSFYSVIAGWSLHYVTLSATNAFGDKSPDEIGGIFGELFVNTKLNVMWHAIFMVLTTLIVMGGVKRGIEAAARILMPTLFILMLVLVGYAMIKGSFAEGLEFIFAAKMEDFEWTSVLAALGQAFFSLSLGMGALITYGSYLKADDDLVSTSITVTALDTSVALLAAIVIFPILFAAGRDPDQGPGLVFATLPIAFSQMPGGAVLAPAFFLLLAFAALTSAISLLEVATAYFIDERGWARGTATAVCGGGVLLLGIPAALSGGTELFGATFQEKVSTLFYVGEGKNWFDTLVDLSFNIMLPVGGLGIAMFVAWRVGGAAREQGFKTSTKLGFLYWGWVQLLRYIVPVAVIVVLLNALGVFGLFGGNGDG